MWLKTVNWNIKYLQNFSFMPWRFMRRNTSHEVKTLGGLRLYALDKYKISEKKDAHLKSLGHHVELDHDC